MDIVLLVSVITLIVATMTLFYMKNQDEFHIDIINPTYILFNELYANNLRFEILNYSRSGIKLIGMEIKSNSKPVEFLIDNNGESKETSFIMEDGDLPRILLPNDTQSFYFCLNNEYKNLEIKLIFDKPIKYFKKTKTIIIKNIK